MSNDHTSNDPNAPSSHDDVHWDPNAVIELGNSLIAFGDLLDEQLLGMTRAQFSLINGAWSGSAAQAMSAAFENQSNGSDPLGDYGVGGQVIKVVVQFWDTGEAINYFALLRNAQEATQAKQQLASFIATIVGFVLSVLAAFIGPLIGAIVAAIARIAALLIEIGGAVGAAVSEVANFVTEAATLIGSGVSAVAETLPDWAVTMAGIAGVSSGLEPTSPGSVPPAWRPAMPGRACRPTGSTSVLCRRQRRAGGNSSPWAPCSRRSPCSLSRASRPGPTS